MKILKLLSNNVSIFTGDDLVLTSTGTIGADYSAPMFTTANAVIDNAPTLPAGYIGGCWTYINGVWAVLPEAQTQVSEAQAAAIAKIKAEKWDAIKARRDNLSDTGGYRVIVGGVEKWFHSDPKSKIQQQGLVLLGANANTVPPWKTMDGTKVAMSQALAQQIFGSAVTMEGTLFAVAETHKTAMEASANPFAYEFLGGWPATYPGV